MRFVFNEKKAAQAAAYLLKLHGGKLNYMVLIKLLYLADRKSLIETGMPITGDVMVSMPHGPVLSMVLDLINMGKPEKQEGWYEYISEPSDYSVSLMKVSLENDELSKYELKVLEGVNKQFGGLDKWALRNLTHEFPEYEDPKGSSLPIPPETVLSRVANKSTEEIERIANDAEELFFFGRLECKPF